MLPSASYPKPDKRLLLKATTLSGSAEHFVGVRLVKLPQGSIVNVSPQFLVMPLGSTEQSVFGVIAEAMRLSASYVYATDRFESLSFVKFRTVPLSLVPKPKPYFKSRMLATVAVPKQAVLALSEVPVVA